VRFARMSGGSWCGWPLALRADGKLLYSLRRIDDGDVFELLQRKQIAVARDDQISACRKCQCQYMVIIGIPADGLRQRRRVHYFGELAHFGEQLLARSAGGTRTASNFGRRLTNRWSGTSQGAGSTGAGGRFSATDPRSGNSATGPSAGTAQRPLDGAPICTQVMLG
jgi:hypothetical protein